MNKSAVAKRYAEALFEAAKGQGQIDSVEAELTAVVGAFNEHPELQAIMNHPSISAEQKKEQLKAVFGAHVSNLVTNFLLVLVDKNRFDELQGIQQDFVDLVDKALGRTKVVVETAVPLTEEEMTTLKSTLGANGKGVDLKTEVNAALIGGAKLRVGDRVYDYSVAGQLERFRQSLKY